MRKLLSLDDKSRIQEMLLSSLMFVVTSVEQRQCRLLNNKKKRSKGLNDSYPFIPYNHNTFLEMLVTLRNYFDAADAIARSKKIKPQKPLFCDAGAGIGMKCILAAGFGFDSFGVELDKRNFKRMTEVFHTYKFVEGQEKSHLEIASWGNPNGEYHLAKIIHDDILKHDFSTYDVVYFYRPIMDTDKEMRFEHRLYKMLKPGAIVIGGYIEKPADFGLKRLKDVCPSVFEGKPDYFSMQFLIKQE